MEPTEPNGIPEKVRQTEQNLLWFVQNVLRGTWFRRLIFLLVAFSITANPASVSAVFSLIGGGHLSRWYSGFYWFTVGLLLLAALLVGARTLPRERPTTIQGSSGAVRGLLPFNPEDSELFSQLERGIELQRVVASLLDPRFRFGILVSPSGAGKTSFLRAGLLARLSQSKSSVMYVELSNEDPLISVERELARQGKLNPSGVVLLDQFEQFFLHQHEAELRRPFIDELARWHQRDSGVTVLAAIRAEDLWQMHEVQEKLDYQLTTKNFFRLSKFSVEQAVVVFASLCQRADIEFDPTFCRRIVRQELLDPEDGLISPVSIGLLVFLLATRRQAFTPVGFRSYGDIPDLLQDWVSSQLEAAKVQGIDKAAASVLASLCDFDQNCRSGSLSVEDISSKLAGRISKQDIDRAANWLADSGVRLAARVDDAECVRYQLTHERLIPAISSATGKLLNEAESANTLLNRRVREWINNDRSSRFLLPTHEYWQIKVQRPHIIWGENRADKEIFLGRSKTKWRIRAAISISSAIFLFGVFYFIGERLIPILATLSAGLGLDLPLIIKLYIVFLNLLFNPLLWLLIILVAVAFAIFRRRVTPSIVRTSRYWTALSLVLGTTSVLFTLAVLIVALIRTFFYLPNLPLAANAVAESTAVREVLRLHSLEEEYRRAHPDLGYACSIEQLRAFQALDELGVDDTLHVRFIGYPNSALILKLNIESCSGRPAIHYAAISKRDTMGIYGGLKPVEAFCIDEKGQAGMVIGSEYKPADAHCIPGEIKAGQQR
jgi:hypothetical protein